MRKLSFIFFVFPLVAKVGFANQGKSLSANSHVDSLWEEYRTVEHDTTKAKILIELTDYIHIYNPDTVIPLCQKAIEIADKNLFYANPQQEISFLHTKASALNNIGWIIEQRGDIEKGLEYYFESLKIFEDFFTEISQKKWRENLDTDAFLNNEKLFKKGLAQCYNNIGVTYMNQGEIEKALEYYSLSLKIREEIKYKKGMAESYHNIGFIYTDQGEIEMALEYFFLSLKIYEEIKDKKGMAGSYNNIGSIYYNQGEIEKTLEYFFLSLKIREDIKDKSGMAVSYHN
ncbi:MAG: tetratricopeptide repeat protein, partial [Bacteroidia bacterium]|nr:tetratricopeptide repeat protein [Bacteroidia bacterium]